MQDLVKQQKIAKDSIRALESLGDKYEREKRELVARLEKEKAESLKRTEQNFDTKVNSLKAINDQISKKLVVFDETQENFQVLQKNYGEAIQIIDDQKRELQQFFREQEDMRLRNNSLEEELKDVQGMLQDQQKIYSSHIKELRSQLHDLEDATKGKYEEQIGSLQLEIKLKND